jgi:hypothetical protein
MDPADIIKSAGGVLLTRDVLARGATESAIRAAVRCGDVVRVERGLLAASGADPDLVAAGRSRGLLTCVSAAPRFGLWQLRPAAQPHYWHSNGRNAVRCISHRLALLCLPPLESLVMVECAYNRGDIDPAFLRRHLAGNRWGKARDVLARVEQGADSLLETLARVLFREAGIATETQVWLDGIGRVDFRFQPADVALMP